MNFCQWWLNEERKKNELRSATKIRKHPYNGKHTSSAMIRLCKLIFCCYFGYWKKRMNNGIFKHSNKPTNQWALDIIGLNLIRYPRDQSWSLNFGAYCRELYKIILTVLNLKKFKLNKTLEILTLFLLFYRFSPLCSLFQFVLCFQMLFHDKKLQNFSVPSHRLYWS